MSRVPIDAFVADPTAALEPLKEGEQVFVVDDDDEVVMVVGSRGLDLCFDLDDDALPLELEGPPLTDEERRASIERWLS